jgi:hypothetical protein
MDLFSDAISVLRFLVLTAGLVLLFVATRRDQKLGDGRNILLAIATAAVLSSTAPFTLPVIGPPWVAIGVILWRYAPENRDVVTTPLTS